MAVEDLFTPVFGSEQLCLEDMMSLGMIVQPVLDDDDDEFSLRRNPVRHGGLLTLLPSIVDNRDRL